MSLQRIETLGRELTAHPRWRWRCGMAIKWKDFELTVVGRTPRDTLLAHFKHGQTGVELSPVEHDITLDLNDAGTAGHLCQLWAEDGGYAVLTIQKKDTDKQYKKRDSVMAHNGAWATIADTGSAMLLSGDDVFGVAIAEALLSLWRRLDNMFPVKASPPEG